MRWRLAVCLVLPWMAGCVDVEPGTSSDAIEAEQVVYAEYEQDRGAATARFLRAWRTGAPDRSRGVDRIRWIAIAHLLNQEGQGPRADIRHLLLQSLDDEDAEIASRAALALVHVKHPAVMNGLLDTVESPTTDAGVREVATHALRTKLNRRMFSAEEGDREVLLRRLDLTCGVKPPSAGMDAVCDAAREPLRDYRRERSLEACAAREGAQVAACIEQMRAPHAACTSGLEPLTTPLKGLPIRADNQFSGKVVVGIVIDPSGAATSPRLLSSQWRPSQGTAGQPDGYETAILVAVSQWTYPPRSAPCRHEVPVVVDMGDSDERATVE